MKSHICAGLCVLGRERADITPRRILLVFCFQPKSIPGGWAGALTWVVSLHPAGERTDASHVFLFFYKMAQRVLEPPVLCGGNQKQQARHEDGGGGSREGGPLTLGPLRCSG